MTLSNLFFPAKSTTLLYNIKGEPVSKISSYAYCNRGVQYDMPFEASIRSWHDVCAGTKGEVVIATDPRFKDGTLGKLRKLEKQLDALRVEEHEWDLSEPGCDGLEKAWARESAREGSPDLLIPFDVDEVAHEKDIHRIRAIGEEQLARGQRVVSMGTLNWFNGFHFKFCEPIYKPRITINDGSITHGIPKTHRKSVMVDNIEVVFALEGTDGAGLIDVSSEMPVEDSMAYCSPLQVRWDYESEILTQETFADLERYTNSLLNKDHIHIHHFSWADIPRKWSMDQTWHYMWERLWNRKYTEGLESYTTFKDENLPVNFWDVVDYRRSTESYKGAITDEMSHPAVFRLDWVQRPKYISEWWDSDERRYWYGEEGTGKDKFVERPSKRRNIMDTIRKRFKPQYGFTDA